MIGYKSICLHCIYLPFCMSIHPSARLSVRPTSVCMSLCMCAHMFRRMCLCTQAVMYECHRTVCLICNNHMNKTRVWIYKFTGNVKASLNNKVYKIRLIVRCLFLVYLIRHNAGCHFPCRLRFHSASSKV